MARAKNACEAQVHAALELPTIVAEDIARQLVSYGRRVPLDEFKSKLRVRCLAIVRSIHRVAFTL